MAASPASHQSCFHLPPSLGQLEAKPAPGWVLDHPTRASDGGCSPTFLWQVPNITWVWNKQAPQGSVVLLHSAEFKD